eukprot:TRINITY_DN19625_c0_g1_i7.p1 TRINITY_DN19625_c0_g1~~TRINITY_DN19625_c0_g1_i7.p1  ORF type:complete len:687 (+),score=122.59 TRINITY_DN19625_c0_g1_i7:3-2063(+)
MALSGPLPSFDAPELRTMAASRNFFTGGADVLEGSWNLSTLLLNSNYMSCELTDLDNSTNLGQGEFFDPVSRTLKIRLRTVLGFNLIDDDDVEAFENIALSFAGNTEMTTAAGDLPPSSTGRSTTVDEIRQGKHGLFSGHSNSKELFFITLPVLLLLHAASIGLAVRTSSRPDASFRSYLVPPPPELRKAAMLSRVCYACIRPMLGMAALGLLLGLLNGLTPTVFSTHGCVDPLVHVSVASVRASSVYQWLFVLGSLVGLALSMAAFRSIARWNEEPRARRVHAVLGVLASESDNISAIHQELVGVWYSNAHGLPCLVGVPRTQEPDALGVALWRRVVFWALHIPLAFVASLPAAGYVLGNNVPAGSGWYYSLLSNSMAIALFKVGFNSALTPALAKKLAMFKHASQEQPPLATSGTAIPFFKTQVVVMLTVEVMSVLLAPMVAVFLLDESCLRYYLWFATDLATLLDSWDIGQRGSEAYRQQFCSRKLVKDYQVVWVSILLVAALLQTTMRLIMALPKIKAMALDMAALKCCSDQKEHDLFSATLDHCFGLVGEISHLLSGILTIVVFGIVAPVLLLLGPVVIWLTLCSVLWVSREQTHKETSEKALVQTSGLRLSMATVEDECYSKCWGWFGAEFGGRILVHPPIRVLLAFGHVGNTAHPRLPAQVGLDHGLGDFSGDFLGPTV